MTTPIPTKSDILWKRKINNDNGIQNEEKHFDLHRDSFLPGFDHRFILTISWMGNKTMKWRNEDCIEVTIKISH